MPAYTEEFIERVRQASDIVDVVGRQVQLQRKGQNLWGLCPFHSEKTPSFSVSPAKQMYYCFGCHAHGTVFNFVMEAERLTFPEAVRTLAERANIEVPEETNVSPATRVREQEKQLLYHVSQWAADVFHEQLLRSPDGIEAKAYLERRGLSADLMQAMHLGFSLPDWSGLMRAAEHSKVPIEALVKLGLIIPRQQQGHYDRFRGRVMIPIADERGRVVGFGGRALDDSQPKYLNSPEHELFSKGKLLFGLYHANKAIGQAGNAILVEGYMDCLAAWQHDIPNVVASLGTALTPTQARLLRRYTNQVILCYDGDSAGLQAAVRGMDILEQVGLLVRVAVLPEGEDPDDCLRKRGLDYFQHEVLDKAKSLLDFRLEMLRLQFDLQDIAGKAQYVVAATAVLAKLDNAVLKTSYSERLAHELQVSAEAVLAELAKHEQGPRTRGWDKNGNSRNTIKNPTHTVLGEDDPIIKGCQVAEGILLSLLLRDLVGAEELLLEWQAEDVYAHPADRQIVTLMLKQLRSGQLIDANRLLEQVEDAVVGQRLAEIAWADSPSEQNADAVARGCILKLKQMAVRQAIADKQGQLITAQSPDAKNGILRELQSLIEKQKVLRH